MRERRWRSFFRILLKLGRPFNLTHPSQHVIRTRDMVRPALAGKIRPDRSRRPRHNVGDVAQTQSGWRWE
jgi:hypothetical protein